ncbi:hypothetical protein ACHAXM_006334 [Skeletonema potamos]
MSLRQARDAPADSPPDEESQSLLVEENSFPVRAPRNATPSPAISAFDAMAAASNTRNPLMLARLVVRKFILLLTTDDEEDFSTPLGYTVGLLKDIILGVVFGILTISFVVVLDHRNVIHLESAHHLRNVAYASISDPETIKLLEAETDMRFMSAADYEAARKEIDDSVTSLDLAKAKLEERTKDLEEKQKELVTLTEEKKKLVEDPKLAGLGDFCGSCKWGSTNCDARVAYLGSQYNLAKIPAMMSLLKQGVCKK